ncbi:MAG: hypothetical protein ACP5N1_06210 [Candidatus Woesearchaeota archaeon]
MGDNILEESNSEGEVSGKVQFNYNTSESNLRVTHSSIEPELESKVVIIPEFDIKLVDQMFKDFYSVPVPDDVRLYVYTPTHVGSSKKIGMLGDFAPSLVYAINKHQNFHLPFREKHLIEFSYSKLCHLYCTLDKSIMYNFFNRHSAQSKVFNLNSVATIMGQPKLRIDTNVLDSGVSDEDILKTLFKIKKNATKLFKEVVSGSFEYDHKDVEPHSFNYPKKLIDMFGNNLDSILLYGSSAKGDGKDYDNLVVLKNLPDNLYDVIKNTSPEENGKEVGIIFVPKYILESFLFTNVSNTLFRDSSRVLHGSVDFPIDSERYQIFKELYHAGFGSGKLISALNMVYRAPEVLFDKPGLFEYFMKLNRFTCHGLMHNKGYVITDKQEILDMLKKDFNYVIPEFIPDKEYLQQSFLEAVKVSVEIAKKMYDPKVAQVPGELILKVKEKLNDKIYVSYKNKVPIYIYKGNEELRIDDNIPVTLLDSRNFGYKSRAKEVAGIVDLPEKFLIAKRI